MKILSKVIKEIKKNFYPTIIQLHKLSIDKLYYEMVKKSLDQKELSTYVKFNNIFELQISKFLKMNFGNTKQTYKETFSLVSSEFLIDKNT